MKQIELTQNQVAIVDDCDFDRVNCFKWFAWRDSGAQSFYAARDDCSNGKKRIYMARFIMGEPTGLLVDHENHDTLDNRQCNLRICTSSQNNMNRRKRKNCSSEFKGVSWCSDRNKWYAYIRIDGKTKPLGRYHDEIEAARIYDQAAIKYFGEFALTNF